MKTFRRTPVGLDTQDHTLDIEVTPEHDWKWRDTAELDEHVKHGLTLHTRWRGMKVGARSMRS